MSAPDLATVLVKAKGDGRKILIPYVVAGMSDDWIAVIHAAFASGADAVEVGLPFSDPIIDGEVIQQASMQALERGTTAPGILAELAREDFAGPLVVMTYFNVIAHLGIERFCGLAAQAGVTGAIVADLSLEEVDDWAKSADESGIATVLLVAPSTPETRTWRIAERSRGFVYAVARMGVTGVRAELGGQLTEVVEKIKKTTDLPVCVGIGVSSAEQANAVAAVADGVIVGSALVQRLLDGEGVQGAATFIASLRAAI